jgi:hypothetical protein
MPIEKESFIVTEPDYNSGIALNEYNGKLSLVSAQEGKDGQIWWRKVYPEVFDKDTKQRVVGDKAIPMGVNLGTPEEAHGVLSDLLIMIETEYGG